MKKQLLQLSFLLLLLAACSAEHHPSQERLFYWFDRPTTVSKELFDLNKNRHSQEWECKSLPLGNGSLGANILGGISSEVVTFNEKTLWTGGPNTRRGADYYWNVNKNSASVLQDIRAAFSSGDPARAGRLTRQHFNSEVAYEKEAEEPFRFGHYTTMGVFQIATQLDENGISGYSRSLSLDSALATVKFVKDGIRYQRDFFISYPDQVLAMRFRADKGHQQQLTFSYIPNPEATGKASSDGKDGLVYTAQLNNNGMQYVIRIHAIQHGGELHIQDGKIKIENADEAVFLITADTDYQANYDPDFHDPETYVGTAPEETTLCRMRAACQQGYDHLLANHYKDYSRLFNRVRLELNPHERTTSLPIDQRLENYRKGNKDYYLEQLYYQFGRYLLIASSRPGNLPANLQGIWQDNTDGPWHIDYHNNINLQMNYWPSCQTNLQECMLPLIDFIRTQIKPGEKTAKAYFGARGWTTSISSNIFGFTTPLASQDMSWNFNPMAGPWLATQVWEYYEYTCDMNFLKETGYDIIKGAARFAADYLWHRPDGSYTAAPSTSPEHGPIDQGATFVHAVIREILDAAIQASTLVEKDVQERQQWQEILQHLVPYQTGRYGQLMEWSADIDDPDDKHRHVNHLFGLHPGHTISPITTPELAKASRIVLEHRGDGATGWSMGWKLNQWARLHDGNHAYLLYNNLLKNGTLDNLWDSHPPFQIDGNFGGCAGITEMLLQSHMKFIHLLPALPDAWPEGKITGLRARGNFEVDIIWQNGRLKEAAIHSHSGQPCHLRYGSQTLSFTTKKGKTYHVAITTEGKLQIF